jgi:hypothetical protein
MPWQPSISPSFIRPVIQNLSAYFRVHSEDALAYFAPPAPTPPPFGHFGISERVDDTMFPWLLTLAVGTDWTLGADGMSAENSHEIIVQVSNVGTDPDALAEDIFIRVNAVTSMIVEMPQASLFEGIAVSDVSPLVINPGRHVYGSFLRQNATQMYRHAASINLFLSYFEK